MNLTIARCVMLASGCILILISLPLGAQSIHALESDTLERFLPQSTLAVMVIPHPHATSEKLRHYIPTLASIKPLQPFLQSISTCFQKFEHAWGIHLSDPVTIFQTPFAIALLDVGMAQDTQGISLIAPEILLLAELTDSAEALQHLLARVIRDHIQSRVPSVEFQTKIVQGVTLWIVSNSEFQIAYTFFDHVFLLAATPESLERIIARRQYSGNEETSEVFKSLYKADPAYMVRHDIAQYDHDLHLYVNIRHIWQKLHEAYHKQCPPPSAPETQRNSLLCEPPPLRSFTWLFSLHENGGHERIFWEMDRQDEQLASSVWTLWSHLRTMENGHLISDRLVPGNVLYYRAWRFDGSDWLQRWKHCFGSFLPDSDQEDVSLQIHKLEQTLQLRVESDILPAFGHEMAIACYDPSRWLHVRGQEASMENFPCFLVIRLHQPERIEHLIQAITAVPLSKITVQGMPVYQLDVPGTITPLTLYAAFIQDFLALTSSQRGLQQIVAVAQQGGSLASLPEYATLSASFAKQCYAKSYLNLRYVFQRVALLQSATPGKSMMFPASLTGILSVTTKVSSGMLTESFSTVGGTVIGTGVILLWALALGLW